MSALPGSNRYPVTSEGIFLWGQQSWLLKSPELALEGAGRRQGLNCLGEIGRGRQREHKSSGNAMATLNTPHRSV